MTYIIGMRLGGYELLAADTLVSHPNGNTNELKIKATPLGLIAGAGIKDLIDNVAREVGRGENPSRQSVQMDVWWEVLMYRGPRRIPDGRDGVDLTNFVATLTFRNATSLYWITPEADWYPLSLAAGRSNAILPYDAPDEETLETVIPRLEARITPQDNFANNDEFTAHIQRHATIAGEEIARMAALSQTVCAQYQVAIHRDNRIKLTGFIDDPAADLNFALVHDL